MKNAYENELPYSFKYYEDNPIFGSRWIIFGESEDRKLVDIADDNGDVFIKIPMAYAKELIKARDRFVDKIENINKKMGGNRRMFNN